MWKACKLFAYILIATYLNIVVKRHMIIISEKYPTSSNWYFSMTFTDFQWLFKAKFHFSRPTSDFMTLQGNTEFPWLFQAGMNHANPILCHALTTHFSSQVSNNVLANTQRNKHVIITSKQCFDVIITCLLHCVLAGVVIPWKSLMHHQGNQDVIISGHNWAEKPLAITHQSCGFHSLFKVIQLTEARTKWPPFADDIFKRTFCNEKVWFSIKISLKFVSNSDGPMGWPDNGLNSRGN